MTAATDGVKRQPQGLAGAPGSRLAQTPSGIEVKETFTSRDLEGWREDEALGAPGSFPFTRGKFESMYRERLWITRNLCGLISPQRTNERLRFLMTAGQTGIALVPDTPTQLGIDADHPVGRNGVGVQGVPISSLEDMRALFSNLPVDRLTASFSVPGVAASMIVAQYFALGSERGIDPGLLRGSVQNDPLQARLTSYDPHNPIELTLRLAVDTIVFCERHMPNWHCTTINAYDLREAGLNAIEEAAFSLAIGAEYVRRTLARGLSVDAFAHRMLIISAAHNDLFEEAAKFRAMRRMWARMMKDFGARRERTCALTLAVHTAGSTLTARQPVNNVVRATVQALAAILGGCQGLDLSCYDEGTSLPSELSAEIAIRTQQVLAYESGVIRCVDPLGGSYYLESLTNEIECRASALVQEIEELGGMAATIEQGWASEVIDRSSFRLHDEIASGQTPVVGVNFSADSSGLDEALPVAPIHLEPCLAQVDAVAAWKTARNAKEVRMTLERVLAAGRDRKAELMPIVLEATTAGATVGEIVGTLRRAYDLPYDPFELVDHPFGL